MPSQYYSHWTDGKPVPTAVLAINYLRDDPESRVAYRTTEVAKAIGRPYNATSQALNKKRDWFVVREVASGNTYYRAMNEGERAMYRASLVEQYRERWGAEYAERAAQQWERQWLGREGLAA